MNRIVQQMKYPRGTFSRKKLFLCMDKFWVVGHCCTSEGRIADELRVTVIKNWVVCSTKLDV